MLSYSIEDRGEAVRGVLQLVAKGRTASARLIRLEVLGFMLEIGNASTVGEIATRCRCTTRRVFTVLSEMREFIGNPRRERPKFTGTTRVE